MRGDCIGDNEGINARDNNPSRGRAGDGAALISFETKLNLTVPNSGTSVPITVFKYNELEILDEIKNHIIATYSKHYVTENNIQLMDHMDPIGGIGFSKWSAMKYLLRLGKKNGMNREDVLKSAHMLVFLLFFLGQQNKESISSQ